MTMTLEQLHDWITRLPGPFQPARRQTDAIEAAIRERDRLRGTPVPKVEWQELTERAERAEAELATLKARIECADAGIVYRCADCKATHVGAAKDMLSKRVRLLVDEPQDDNAKEGRNRE